MIPETRTHQLYVVMWFRRCLKVLSLTNKEIEKWISCKRYLRNSRAKLTLFTEALTGFSCRREIPSKAKAVPVPSSSEEGNHENICFFMHFHFHCYITGKWKFNIFGWKLSKNKLAKFGFSAEQSCEPSSLHTKPSHHGIRGVFELGPLCHFMWR